MKFEFEQIQNLIRKRKRKMKETKTKKEKMKNERNRKENKKEMKKRKTKKNEKRKKKRKNKKKQKLGRSLECVGTRGTAHLCARGARRENLLPLKAANRVRHCTIRYTDIYYFRCLIFLVRTS